MTTRRTFIKAAGSIVVYISMAPQGVSAQDNAAAELPGSLAANPNLDTWLRIGADGTVALSPGKCELGQGVKTALAQIAADELDIDMSRMRVMTVDTAHSPNEIYTSGSRSIEHSGAAIRVAAAETRSILIELAAQELDIVVSRIDVSDGAFTVDGGRTGLDYWAVVADKTLSRRARGTAAPKRRDQYALVGKSIRRIDIPGKAFAEEAFVQDMRLPGMLHARVVRGGDREARLSLPDNFDEIRELRGIVDIVRDGSFLAVVAEREEQAIKAARRLAALCNWSREALPFDDISLDQWLRKAPAEVKVVAERGNVGTTKLVSRINKSYSRAFHAHASMSPSAAIAMRDDDHLTVWTHAQGVYPLRGAIAEIVGLDVQRVQCIHAEASGCYGHNGADDAACDAALIAMQIPGKPIRLQWSRADEFQGEPYGSAMSTEISAGLDGDGHIVDWTFDVWSGSHTTRPRVAGAFIAAQQLAKPLPIAKVGNIPQPRGGGDRNAVPLYDFANHRITKHLVPDMPLRVSALRALGAYANVFSIESFMDEIATARGEDPINFRIRHLDDQRAIDVLEKLREQLQVAGMMTAEQPAGVGIGMARYKNSGAYCAVAMRVVIDEDGAIKLDHALCAVDVGLAINPDGVINQFEGGIIQASSWTVRERVRLGQHGASSRNWADYPILKFSEVPRVDVALIDRPDEPPLGAGEAAQGPTAAAIGNAVANATGIRLRELPLTPEKLRQAWPGNNLRGAAACCANDCIRRSDSARLEAASLRQAGEGEPK